MANWLLKTEPEEYSWDDLVRQKTGIWDGVRNNQALIYLRMMKMRDTAFIYHTGKERQIVGIAEIVSNPYPDPKENNEKWVVVQVRPLERLTNTVMLQDIKSDSVFADFLLVKFARLSVMPVTDAWWNRILEMSKI